jgi:hypothetical protein
MKYFLRALAIIVSFGLLFFLALRSVPIHVYDGFESPRLSRFRWTNRRFEPGAVVSEESVVRSGRRALAITVHSGDRPEATMAISFQSDEEVLQKLRERLSKMSDQELIKFGKEVRWLAENPFQRQLEEARAEWKRRKRASK